MTHRRRRSMSPEERAEVLNDPDYFASGNSYISVVMRETRKYGKVPYYDNPDKCDHGVGMCPTWECIESWSLDYTVNLPLTGAGRRLAAALNIDARKFALHKRSAIERLDIEDFRPDEVKVT